MQIIVVEGIHDEAKIKEVYPDAFVITTNGREISEDTLNMLEKYSKDNEIVLFLDPDYPGERIRTLITDRIPNCKHAFIRKKDGISKNKRKVGIEHAEKDVIKEALDNIYITNNDLCNIKLNDLYNLNLVGSDDSKKIRDYVSQRLNIGSPNAKTFLKRVNSFNISLEEIKGYIDEYAKSNS